MAQCFYFAGCFVHQGLQHMKDPVNEHKVVEMARFLRHHPHNDCVPDPYYDGAEGFELVLDLLEDACEGLLDELCKKTDQQ